MSYRNRVYIMPAQIIPGDFQRQAPGLKLKQNQAAQSKIIILNIHSRNALLL